ncbi:response regulator transcription factor [Candidatus Margulisiibacteriota bacterium]
MLENLQNMIFLVTENAEDEKYFMQLKEECPRYLLFLNPLDSLNYLAQQKSIDINEAIFLISGELKKIVVKDFLGKLREYVGTTQALVYADNPDVEYVKSIMKAGADEYLQLITKAELSDYDKKTAWQEKVLRGVLKLAENIKNADVMRKLDDAKRDNWQTALIGETNRKILEYFEADNRTRTREGKEPKGYKYLETLDELMAFLVKETGTMVEEREKAKVLVVEDEAGYRDLINSALEERYIILEAENGFKSLDLAEKHKDIDIALLDIMLPDIKGTELVSSLKNMNKKITCIMLTAFKETDLISNSLGNGAFDFINKPFKKDFLIDKINSALDKRYYTDNLTTLSLKLG